MHMTQSSFFLDVPKVFGYHPYDSFIQNVPHSLMVVEVVNVIQGILIPWHCLSSTSLKRQLSVY